jgi:hypothetical protein
MGRFKLIESPEKMWELFKQYKKHIKSQPFVIGDWVGGMAMPVDRLKEKPLTLEGFDNYLYEAEIIDGIDQYFSNQGGAYSDFLGVCSRIRSAIREDQISGGMAGIYNPSITQRLNGLVEKSEQKVIQEQPLFPDEE